MPKPELGLTSRETALLALARAVRETGYAFSTVTPLTQARVNARPGHARATDLAGVFGWSRPFTRSVLPAPILRLMQDADVLRPHEGDWRSTVRLSSLGSLLFLHSAYPTTAADAVFFGPDTCRFATAIRAHVARMERPPARVVDIGCGAGPGGILVATMAPAADVLMVDINEAALSLARVNAALNGTPRAEARRSDLLQDTTGSFDLIVSNPPYLVDGARRAYRHGGGVRGEGLSIAILEAALGRLSPKGSLLLYTGSAIVEGIDGLRDAASRVLAGTAHRWSYVEVDPDVFGEELETEPYADADRIAAVVLTVTGEDPTHA